MYTIIGGDNKPYGPSTAEEVREWLKQGRANGSTLARLDEGVWKPLAAFPEFADLTGGPGAPPALPGRGIPTPEEVLARDYDLDILDCAKRGWNLVMQNFWPVVGITFLVLLAVGGINQVISLLSGSAVQDMMTSPYKITVPGVGIFFLTSIIGAVLQAVFVGGLYRFYLLLIRGEEATMGDAFSGFNLALGPLAMLGLLMGLFTLSPLGIYGMVLAILGKGLTVMSGVGALILLIPTIYLNISWIFASALVIDRGLSAWSAMSLSLRAVGKHWFVVFGLLLVAGLVGACGFCAFCIGIFVTMPVLYVMLMCAYEDIFGSRAG